MAGEIADLAATVARREAGQQAAGKAQRSRVSPRAAQRGALQQQFLLWCGDPLLIQVRLIGDALAPPPHFSDSSSGAWCAEAAAFAARLGLADQKPRRPMPYCKCSAR